MGAISTTDPMRYIHTKIPLETKDSQHGPKWETVSKEITFNEWINTDKWDTNHAFNKQIVL